jgi:pre-mRNA-splicing factor SYF1
MAEAFEAELLRNPYSLETWLSYIESSCSCVARLSLYDRAVSSLPGSYKLWIAYVKEAVKAVRAHCLCCAHPRALIGHL